MGSLLARACGAEAALVVNNGAAALLVVLAALAAGRPTAVSRGELIEIGGGFRLPEIMALSGSRLLEVGTTNRTRPDDYRQRRAEAALLLKVHTSNYRIEGFTERGRVAELARSARRWWWTSAPGCSTPPAPGCPTARPAGWPRSPRSARRWRRARRSSPSRATSSWAAPRRASSPDGPT